MERDCVQSTASSDESLHTSTLLLSACSSTRHHRRRRTETRTLLRQAKRLLFTVIITFFLIGTLITTFGFVGLHAIPSPVQLVLRIVGPVCLAVDLVTCLACVVVFRLWRKEWKRRRQAVELRNRVLLHALAIDVMNKTSINELVRDSGDRRKVRQQMRQETAAENSNSMKSYQNISLTRNQSGCSITIDAPTLPSSLPGAGSETGRRRSSCHSVSPGLCVVDRSSSILQLPGIQISRIETLNLSGDELPLGSICRSVLIESEVSGEVYRISCISEYSLSGGNRSSRASSYSSRIWDLSSRESEWDADVSIGSRESQVSVAHQDWSGGPAADFPRRDFLSPMTTRQAPTVVSLDVGSSVTGRRHSSPTECLKCKECRGSTLAIPGSGTAKSNLLSVLKQEYPLPDLTRKCSSEDAQLSSSPRIRLTRVVDRWMEQPDEFRSHVPPPTRVLKDRHRRSSEVKMGRICIRNRSTGSSDTLLCVRTPKIGDQHHHTDDSEIEQRVNRLLYEIEYSVADSVDESKIRSQEFEPIPTKVDMETQTNLV